MKELFKKLFAYLQLRHFLLAVPLLLGILGFCIIEGEPFLHSTFLCVCMYVLNYQDVPPNILVELARWLAPIATASGILMAIASLREAIGNYLVYRAGKSVAVWGPKEEKQALLEQLGKNGIDMGDTPVKAHTYLLIGEEHANLEFYHLNKAAFKDADVYIKCASLPAQASGNPKLHLFSPEETAARLFWKQNSPYAVSAERGHQMDIVIIGFGKLGQELLLSALQSNIFHPEQKLHYHIFGDEAGFRQVYHQVDAISDPVTFYPDPWYKHRTLLDDAGMVIVVEQNNQLALLEELTTALITQRIHVFAADQFDAGVLEAKSPYDRILRYNWRAEAMNTDHIIGEKLLDYAKRINLRYAHLYENVEETEENKEAQWIALDSFTRYSNISPADYHDIRKIMMAQLGWTRELTPEQMELLAELEHIRWNRYHFLHNWKKGGIKKDKVLRLHPCLVNYCELSEPEKQKDRDNILLMFDLDEKNA